MNAPKHIMPPRVDKPMKRPAISMAEDAKRCNARMRKVTTTGNVTSSEARDKLAAEVRARRQVQQVAVLACLATGPATVADIMAVCHIADHTARECLLALQAEGKASKQEGYMRGGKAVWALVGPA